MAAPMQMLYVFLCTVFVTTCIAQLELDERFSELRKEGLWLVEFYAPWCGHCKKLEPIYHEVSKHFRGSPVRVAKVDATRYSSIATEFDVRGFPTIKFINKDTVHTHRGDRSKHDIIEFAKKAQGPAVRKLASPGKFSEAKFEHKTGVFFYYAGKCEDGESLFDMYSSVAEKYLVQGYFYAGTQDILPENIRNRLKGNPTVLVFKDNEFYEYEDEEGVVRQSSLDTWVKTERCTAYPRVVGGGLNEVADMGKLLVVAVLHEDDDEFKQENSWIKTVVESVAQQSRGNFHRTYQFLWMPDMETGNSIVMSFLNLPFIFVLDPVKHVHYLPSEAEPSDITVEGLKEFLLNIEKGKIQSYGGTSFMQRLLRVGYDIVSTVAGIWQASRWLFLLMFGLPTVIISIVCYSLCCMETIDDEMPDSDEDEDMIDDDSRLNQESKSIEEKKED